MLHPGRDQGRVPRGPGRQARRPPGVPARQELGGPVPQDEQDRALGARARHAGGGRGGEVGERRGVPRVRDHGAGQGQVLVLPRRRDRGTARHEPHPVGPLHKEQPVPLAAPGLPRRLRGLHDLPGVQRGRAGQRDGPGEQPGRGPGQRGGLPRDAGVGVAGPHVRGPGGRGAQVLGGRVLGEAGDAGHGPGRRRAPRGRDGGRAALRVPRHGARRRAALGRPDPHVRHPRQRPGQVLGLERVRGAGHRHRGLGARPRGRRHGGRAALRGPGDGRGGGTR